MGRSQLVSAGVAAALLAFGSACGEPASLLVPAEVEGVYGEGGAYGPKSMEPSEFASISGMVKFEGTPLKSGDLKLSDEFCVNANTGGLASEEFLFDANTGALEGVFVYISKGVNKRVEDLHEVPTEPVVLDQIGCRYVPHHVILRVGQPLVIKSSDNTLHNVKMIGRNIDFNETMNSPRSLDPKVFDLAEPEPVQVKCDVHGWMRAFISIRRHPYCVLTAKDGTFKLEGVPPGTYKLTFFHEKSDVLPPVHLDVDVEPGQPLELKEPVVFSRN